MGRLVGDRVHAHTSGGCREPHAFEHIGERGGVHSWGEGLVEQLPPEVRGVLARHEAANTTDSVEYQEACRFFYRLHLSRIDPPTDEMLRSRANIANTPVYKYMWGPSEFTCTGNLKGWDRSDRLGEIAVPTLITHGRYDEMVPELALELREGIPNSEVVTFENSAHSAHLEESELYIATLRRFLNRVEAK